MRKLRDM